MLADKTYSQDAMIDFLVSFFNMHHEYKTKKELNKGASKNKDQLFLICLDNACQVIEHVKEEFLHFLAHLYDECKNLRVIVTSNRDIGALPNNYHPKPFLLKKLKDSKAVELFLDRCGPYDRDEILDLIVEDKNFPYSKWLKNYD